MTTKYTKPNGVTVPVNENSESHARSLGWLPESEFKAAQKKAETDAKAKAEAEAKAKVEADAKAKAEADAKKG